MSAHDYFAVTGASVSSTTTYYSEPIKLSEFLEDWLVTGTATGTAAGGLGIRVTNDDGRHASAKWSVMSFSPSDTLALDAAGTATDHIRATRMRGAWAQLYWINASGAGSIGATVNRGRSK